MAEVQWNQACLENIQKLDGTPCPADLCESAIVKQYIHVICNCLPPYENGCRPVRFDGCCAYTADSPVPVMSTGSICYCCCTGGAQSMPVAYDAARYKPIADFMIGDPLYVADDPTLQRWSRRPVQFSAGTGVADGPSTMIRVTYGTPERKDSLLVSRAQVFLTPDRRLQTAATLVPGRDALVSNVGEPRPVLALEDAAPGNGLHHIATSATPASSAGGHLILAKDIVCGDWSLQVSVTTGSVPLNPA